MKRFVISLFLVLSLAGLSGCGILSDFFASDPLTKEEQAQLNTEAKIFQARGEFNILLGFSVAYSELEFCNNTVVVGCSDRATVIDMDDLAVKIEGGLKQAEAFGSADELSKVEIGIAALNNIILTRLLKLPGS